MKLYDKNKIVKLLQQDKGNAIDFINQIESHKIDQMKAKFYMENLIVEVVKLLNDNEERK